jgi:hypothetical protein
MSRVRFQVVTIECDSTDHVLLEQLRGLLPAATIVAEPVYKRTPAPSSPAPAETPARAVANHLLDGSLQELALEGVQENPGITLPGLCSLVMNDTSQSAKTRMGSAIAPLCTIGRLVRSQTGKLYTPAAAATLPEFQGKGTKVPAPDLPERAAAEERKPCPEFPPCLGCRGALKGPCVGIAGVDKPANPALEQKPKAPPSTLAGLDLRVLDLVGQRPGIRTVELASELLGESSKGARIRMGRVLTPLILKGKLSRRGLDTHFLRGVAPAAEELQPRAEHAIRALVEDVAAPPAPLRVHVPQGATMPKSSPVGHVAGAVAPAVVPGSLADRLVQAVLEQPGTTVHELAAKLLGDATGANVRRIDMLAGPLTMGGKLARYNGRLYKDLKQASALKLPPPQQHEGKRRLGAGQAPLDQVQQQKALFDQIVEAFAENESTPLHGLAAELFGESTGRSKTKLELMLRQLCASGRLELVGAHRYRAVTEADRGKAAEAEEADGDEASDEKEQDELESNGQPDDWAEPEELEVG